MVIWVSPIGFFMLNWEKNFILIIYLGIQPAEMCVIYDIAPYNPSIIVKAVCVYLR